MDSPETLTLGQEDPEQLGIEDVYNILLCTPPSARRTVSLCTDLLTPEAPPRENVLVVTLTGTPDGRVETWNRHVGEPPAEFVILAAGEHPGSSPVPPTATVEGVPEPVSLTRLGVAITDHLAEWTGPSNRTVLCVQSLTALLQRADLEQVFRFLAVLTAQVETAGALAHYHVDPAAHDEQTLGALRPLYDVRIEHDGTTVEIVR